MIGEVVLVVAVLLVASRLTTQQPARDALAQEANQIDVVFDLQGRHLRCHLPLANLARTTTGFRSAVIRYLPTPRRCFGLPCQASTPLKTR